MLRLLMILAFLVSYAPLITASTGSQYQPTSGGFGFIIIILLIICYTRRKREIGGWYLYFLIQLFLAIAISIPTTIYSLITNNPGDFINAGYYLLFLLTLLPSMILLIAQGVIAITMISKKGRDWKLVKLLIKVLWADLMISILNLLIDIAYWPESSPLDILAIIWPVIWLPYFIRSKRIRQIYETKTWGLEMPGQHSQKTGDIRNPEILP